MLLFLMVTTTWLVIPPGFSRPSQMRLYGASCQQQGLRAKYPTSLEQQEARE